MNKKLLLVVVAAVVAPAIALAWYYSCVRADELRLAWITGRLPWHLVEVTFTGQGISARCSDPAAIAYLQQACVRCGDDAHGGITYLVVFHFKEGELRYDALVGPNALSLGTPPGDEVFLSDPRYGDVPLVAPIPPVLSQLLERLANPENEPSK